MVKRLVFAVAILALSATTAMVFAQRQGTNTTPAKGRYLPEYTKEGDLILPKNWRSWVYVGSPLTPDGLNDNKEAFPEYHNVYIEPGSYEIYKKTGEFPDGTIMFKELQRVLGPKDFPDGSLTQPSGRGYFPGAFNGADVTVKDSKAVRADRQHLGVLQLQSSRAESPDRQAEAEE